MKKTYDALVLFSGGLDSLLAARLLMRQGLSVLCLHFYTPFFGNPAKIDWWRRTYGLEVEAIDVSLPFLDMFASYPPHGTGKTLNPCVDCKIVLLKMAKALLPAYGAQFLATGEVVGQRPMSQRTESLNVITKCSETGDILLRPLCARHLRPTQMEENGLVNRDELCNFCGRGRNGQLDLAAEMGITEIPAPAGGCKLTEHENVRRYWPLLRNAWLNGSKPELDTLIHDFVLVNLGRILFHEASGAILCVGRNEADNKRILAQKKSGDILLRLPFPGPLALIRHCSTSGRLLSQAADILASYAHGARLSGGSVQISAKADTGQSLLDAKPAKHEQEWLLPAWQETSDQIRDYRRKLAARA